MDDKTPNNWMDDPEWLDEFQELADSELGDGSACEQVHPIVENWYSELLQGEPPDSRDAVLQAMACLSTELIFDAPEGLSETLLELVDEDELSLWVQHILLVGRAFQLGLTNGELDDL